MHSFPFNRPEQQKPARPSRSSRFLGFREHVSFIYSYPNLIPLSASAVERLTKAVEPFKYDRVYGAFWDTVIERDGKAAVRRSAERYVRAVKQ